ncbi:MAG: DUF3450 domain-containing protein [Desulfobacterales bacterium]
MIQRILLSMALLILFGSQVAFGQTPDSVQKKVSKAIDREAKAQKKADDWSWDKRDLVDEIRDLKTRVTWLQYQEEKHEIYIVRVKRNIEDLKFRKAEALKVREQLDPYLEEVVNRLAAAVQVDLPFLPDERQRRIDFLKDSLNDYQLMLSEKLRRVLEGVQVETLYGKMVTSTDTTLNIAGSDTQVSLLRLGRVTMYYLSLDGTQVGQWNDETKQWESLDEGFIRSIRRLLDMAERKRSVELTELPLGAL